MKNRIITLAVASLLAGGATVSNVALADDNDGRTAGQAVAQTVDDAAVLAKIKTEMLQDRAVSGLAVNVDVKDGHVTLSGKAKSEAERKKAEDIAKGTSGVKGVDNKIALEAN